MTGDPRLNAALARAANPPVLRARDWLADASFSAERPLINVSQALPTLPPPESLRRALAEAVLYRNDAHVYGPTLGNTDLRQAIAQEWSVLYGAGFSLHDVAITQGGTQAFCAAMASLAGAGDEVILPSPWYFSNRAWLDVAGVHTVALPCGDDGLPDPDRARALITPRTRAIALVSPNNPTGADYPPDLLRAFYDLCRTAGIALVLNETLRDFHGTAHRDGDRPHDLFADPDWPDTLLQIYSFSKAYRLTGHRVGAIVAAPARLEQVAKWLDGVAICAPQIGQIAAVTALRQLRGWLADERVEILARGRTARVALGAMPGWQVKTCGGYFCWIAHPFADDADRVTARLVREAGVLALPGSMFVEAGDPAGARHFRIAFGNVDAPTIAEMARRLAAMGTD